LEVAIIDYGMGNLRSVANALESLDVVPTITADPADLRRAKRIILPGVGAFGKGMANLRSGGWIDVLNDEVMGKRKPFAGFCLGMQLLGSVGFEHGRHEGLGWIGGSVERLEAADPSIRIPHIGWNETRLVKSDGLYRDMGATATFYFVHSYVLRPEDDGVVSGVAEHGTSFVASVETGNIVATQFHPEKSQRGGLGVIRNFLAMQA
jgi:glutamine amidotransferase